MDDRDYNWIKISRDGLRGNVAARAFNVDFEGEARGEYHTAVYTLYALSPRGQRIEVGAVWEWKGAGEARLSMVLETDHGRFFARLCPVSVQDKTRLYRIEPHSPVESESP